MQDALALLATRRSVKPIELAGPPPSPAEIDTLLTVASRVPDHGKLTPWRFIVFEGNARVTIGAVIAEAFKADRPDATPDQVEFERNRLARVIRAREGSAPSGEGPFDIVLANLIASLLVTLADGLVEDLRPGGTLLASGIFIDREAGVVAAFEARGLRVENRWTEGDWVALEVVRPA